MAHICIITPGQVGSNPRVVKEADALVMAGHEVTVIATKVMPEVEDRDRSIIEQARWKIIRVPFDNYWRRRIDRVIQELARLAFKMTGTARFAAYGHSAMTHRLRRAADSIRADLYIAHYVAAIPAAISSAAKHNAPYAFDAEDFHPGDLPDDPRHDTDRAMICMIEGRALPGAAYVTAAAPGIAEAYACQYRIALPEVVLNVFPLSQAPDNLNARGKAMPLAPSIYWFSQTVGPDRGLECAVCAISQARSQPDLYLRGRISPDYRRKLEVLAEDRGVTERLHFLPPANPHDMVPLAAAHDIGLVSETGHSRNRRIALTNKQFTYFLAGIPVLMSDIEAHREFAKLAEGAVKLYRTNDQASLAEAIDAICADEKALRAMGRRASELGVSCFNWDKEQAKLVSVVERALKLIPTPVGQGR